jgi:hypothetical protein
VTAANKGRVSRRVTAHVTLAGAEYRSTTAEDSPLLFFKQSSLKKRHESNAVEHARQRFLPRDDAPKLVRVFRNT